MTTSSDQPLIVVGVSDRSKSPTALRWAAAAAAMRGARLLAVRAARLGDGTADLGPTDETAVDGDPLGIALRRLRVDVAEVLGAGHTAEVRLVTGGKRRALLDAARHADLLVIDAPLRLDIGSGPGFLQRLLHGLDCPLVVVPRAISGAPPTTAAQAVRSVGRAMVESAGRAPRPGFGRPQPSGRP